MEDLEKFNTLINEAKTIVAPLQQKIFSSFSKKSLIGFIKNTKKCKLTLDFFEEYLDEMAKSAEKADKILDSQKTDYDTINLYNCLSNVTDTEEPIIKLEIDNGPKRNLSLKNNTGNIFNSILITLTTLTAGIIAAIMIIK